MVLGVRWDVDIFKLTASAQSIYREVYVITYNEQDSPVYIFSTIDLLFIFHPT